MVNLEIVKIDKTLNLNNSYIYKLSLCNKREYIGYFKYTKKVNNLPERLWKHINGDGAEYVKKYKPKIKQNILQCKIYKSSRNFFAYEMFITLQRMDKHGINKVRGGPFSWVRNYNYRERIVIQYFIDEMKQGWINFLRCYNTFKIFDYDDFYVHISGITTSRLFSRQQIGLFNYIIHHIKEKKYIQNCSQRSDDTIYVRIDPVLDEIKRLSKQNEMFRNKNRELSNKVTSYKRKFDELNNNDDSFSNKRQKT